MLSCQLTQNMPDMQDIVSREGNGDNLPYPGVDYLGNGYNLMYGNPEGDKVTQVDPGFRLPIVVSDSIHTFAFLMCSYIFLALLLLTNLSCCHKRNWNGTRIIFPEM